MNFITRLTASMSTAKGYFLRSNSVKMELDLSAAPEEILQEIFLRVDEKVLVKNCTRVSKLWHRLLSQKSFWIRKCEYNGYLFDQFEAIRQDGALVLGQLPVDLSKVCVLRPFEKNLINDGGASGTATTRRYHNDYAHPRGYDRRWQIEGDLAHQEPPSFMSSHNDPDFDDAGIDKCLVSSYMWCKKRMEIDLIKAGLDAETLDKLRPAITVSEYVANRADCSAIYRISVGLLGEGVENSAETYWHETKEWEQWETQRWTKIEHTFRDYPAGVRRIGLLCEGKDKQFWAGHYGSKMARCSVVVNFDFNPPSATDAPPAPQDEDAPPAPQYDTNGNEMPVSLHP